MASFPYVLERQTLNILLFWNQWSELKLKLIWQKWLLGGPLQKELKEIWSIKIVHGCKGAWLITVAKTSKSSFVKPVVRLISGVDVVITPMNPYQPIPFNILSFVVFQSRILIYAGSNIYVLRGRIDLVKKHININNIKNIYMNKIISHQTL